MRTAFHIVLEQKKKAASIRPSILCTQLTSMRYLLLSIDRPPNCLDDVDALIMVPISDNILDLFLLYSAISDLIHLYCSSKLKLKNYTKL